MEWEILLNFLRLFVKVSPAIADYFEVQLPFNSFYIPIDAFPRFQTNKKKFAVMKQLTGTMWRERRRKEECWMPRTYSMIPHCVLEIKTGFSGEDVEEDWDDMTKVWNIYYN